MPVLYQIEPSLNLIYYFAYGHLTQDEVLQAVMKASESPLRKPFMLILHDLLSVEQLDVDIQALGKNAASINIQRLDQDQDLEPTAVVINRDYSEVLEFTLRFLMADLPIKMKRCEELSEAIRWLGLGEQEADVMKIPALMEKRIHMQTLPGQD